MRVIMKVGIFATLIRAAASIAVAALGTTLARTDPSSGLAPQTGKVIELPLIESALARKQLYVYQV